jgi:hypothetical protein
LSALRVKVDGVALDDAEARAMWQRFSVWMDAHEGDLAGFARAEGFASLHPEMQAGEPVLVASRTAAQRPYVTATQKDVGRGPSPKRRRKNRDRRMDR